MMITLKTLVKCKLTIGRCFDELNHNIDIGFHKLDHNEHYVDILVKIVLASEKAGKECAEFSALLDGALRREAWILDEIPLLDLVRRSPPLPFTRNA